MRLRSMSKVARIVAVAVLVVVAGVVGVVLTRQAHAQEYTGVAGTTTDGRLLIDGKPVIITDNTTIEGTISAGATLLIRAKVQPDGSLLATFIQVKRAYSESDDDDEFEGTITSVGLATDGKTPVSITVGDRVFQVTNHTELEGTLVAGARVEIEYVSQNGVLVAREIEVGGGDDDDQEDD